MVGMIDRISRLANKYRSELDMCRELFKKNAAPWIIKHHRFLAVADYIETGDVNKFRDHLRKATEYKIQMFERAKKGERISESFLIQSSFREVFNPLAAGDLDLARQLMEEMKDIKLVKRDTTYGYSFNMIFRNLILNLEQDSIKQVLSDFEDQCKRRFKSEMGYPLCFRAIYHKDKEGFMKGFEFMMKGHRRIFQDNEDEVIGIRPLGIVNLARMKGMDVMVDHPLVPKDLLV
jgi:hypothetical protein